MLRARWVPRGTRRWALSVYPARFNSTPNICAPLNISLQQRNLTRTIHGAVISIEVQKLLEPFDLRLTTEQQAKLLAYLELLFRWNRSINLTAIRTPEECVTRHFGESLFLSRWVNLEGRLLDIGSGAGFPGLALKLLYPELLVTLLEPNSKKRAFLKEVARTCSMYGVNVRPERLENLPQSEISPGFDTITMRAVGDLEQLTSLASKSVKVGGRLCLWLTRSKAVSLSRAAPLIHWNAPIALPLSKQREIWVGTRHGASS